MTVTNQRNARSQGPEATSPDRADPDDPRRVGPGGAVRALALTPVAYDQGVLDLVLLRHGQSIWNAENLFTGWVDVDLTEKGEAEARDGGRLLAEEPGLDLRILHTSLLTRAIRTAELALHAAGRSWLPVRRDWRLNERHYGDLQGKNKAETMAKFGKEQLHAVAPELRHPAAPAVGRQSTVQRRRSPLSRRGAVGHPRDRVPGRRGRAGPFPIGRR